MPIINVGKLTQEESRDLFVELANALTEEQLFEALQQILTQEQKRELVAEWTEE
jgi:phenylpyruvate tautomerase PptA (4-oxalocrotonate tautomerase family)